MVRRPRASGSGSRSASGSSTALGRSCTTRLRCRSTCSAAEEWPTSNPDCSERPVWTHPSKFSWPSPWTDGPDQLKTRQRSCIGMRSGSRPGLTHLPRVGRLEWRLDLVQVENHPFSRFGRETDACENLLELVVGPPAANVVGRFPDADDVERILTRGAVVAELTEGNGPSTLHDQRVPTVIHRLQFVDVADELRDEHCWHDARVEPKRTHMFRTLMPRSALWTVADQLTDVWAGSTGVRKELGELFGWFHESECLAGPVVEARRDAGQVFGSVDG